MDKIDSGYDQAALLCYKKPELVVEVADQPCLIYGEAGIREAIGA